MDLESSSLMDLESSILSFCYPSSSAHPFSSSSTRYAWKYDVFISFRGQDTRLGFTGNLYNALNGKGVHTFFDDNDLQSGEEITPALLNAIEESRIAIIVLSPNYAASSFCLEELAHILHCIKGNNRYVLPVFFKVDPSDVRHLKNRFGEAMAKHENRYKDHMNNKVDTWKKALKEVANLSGYHFKDGHGYEHEFIKNIVEDISKKIGRLPLPVADYPVGLESRVSKVISLLEMDSTDRVHMVGIHGIGGIGKTTLARAVYNLIADNFKEVCFLENVRENSQKHGLVHLQNNLLSKMLGKEGVQIIGVSEGISQIQRRLSQMKVLLVLDDVDDPKQLEAIAGKLDWFGGGSRVIITTRDTHLLSLHGVKRTYKVQGLNREESLDLLTWKTFKTNIIIPSYADVLNRAITYAFGHPLALEIIGSNLFEKEVDVWESALDQFEKHPDTKIHKILQVSFDALGKEEQNVFLDIACCFKGYSLMEVKDILQAHYGSCMKYHIQVLVDKSLLKATWNERVEMHDLIEDMGKEIVLKRSPEMPGKRSRLWFYEDIVKVLENNQGTSATEIIYLEFPFFKRKEDEDPLREEKNKDVEVKWDGKAFKEMKNLRMLIIKNGWFSRAPKYLPNSLRVLEWWRYPSKYLPSDFQPKELSILKLPDNICMPPMLDSLCQKLVTLKLLNFDKSEFLKEIQDVSSLQNLQELSFKACSNLVTVHNSVGFLPKLKILNAEKCCKLRSFPLVIKLPLLQTLGLCGCSRLENFPEIPEEIKNVEMLDLKGTGIKNLPYSFCNLSGLSSLKMGRDPRYFILRGILMMPLRYGCKISGRGNKGRVLGKQEEKGLQGILTHSVSAENLKDLYLTFSNLSVDFFSRAVAWFPNVQKLDLRGNNFTVLPECIKKFRFLKDLNVDHCASLQEIRGIPPKLEEFSAANCKSLSYRGTSVLLNQQVHEGGNTHFVMPGRMPKWFEKRCRGNSISFWFRGNTFPEDICFAILLRDDLPFPVEVTDMLRVNDNQPSAGFRSTIMDQLLIFALSTTNDYEEIEGLENKWNYAEVSYMASPVRMFPDKVFPIKSTAKEIGMHVFDQKSSITQDIRFTDPYRMTGLIIMMMMMSKVFPNRKNQPWVPERCIGLWTLQFLTYTLFGRRVSGNTISILSILEKTRRPGDPFISVKDNYYW